MSGTAVVRPIPIVVQNAKATKEPIMKTSPWAKLISPTIP